MELDYESLEQKKAELLSLAQQALPSGTIPIDEIMEPIANSFIRLTPPTKPEMMIEMITIHSQGRSGGQSRKAGNIFLNWRKLMDTVPDITIAGVGANTGQVWLLPFIGLYIWNKLWCNSNEKFSKVEATAIYALWKIKKKKISEDEGFEATNVHREKMGLPSLTRSEFDIAMNKLIRLKCIEMKEGIIWLREWVRTTY